jgi:hypothetical protein
LVLQFEQEHFLSERLSLVWGFLTFLAGGASPVLYASKPERPEQLTIEYY